MIVAGLSCFQAEYLRRSGPGAEFAFILLRVFDNSSSVIGDTMTSEGVGLAQSWRGGDPTGVLPLSSACLATK